MLKGLLGTLGALSGASEAAGEVKSLMALGKRYPNAGGTYSLLGMSITANGGGDINSHSKLLSPDHFVNFRWHDGGMGRPGARYFTEVDPLENRAALYYFTTPTSGGMIELNQHFISDGVYPLTREFVTRFNQNSLMGQGACVGMTPPDIKLWNGLPSLVYCFAAGIDYHNCHQAHNNNDILNSVGEALADGAARMGTGLYDIVHNKKRTVQNAFGAMPKSKVQKELKSHELDKVSAILQNGAKFARLTAIADGQHAWRLEGTGEAGTPTIAYVTKSGHIAIETRLTPPVPANRREEAMDLLDTVNVQLLGLMTFAVIDLDTGRAAVRTGVRVNKGIDKFEPQIVANMIAENLSVAPAVLAALVDISGGKGMLEAYAQNNVQLPEPSESRSLVMSGRFLFRL